MNNDTVLLTENQDIISYLSQINKTDFAVYHIIEHSKDISQQEIADAIGKHVVSVKRSIAKLARLGLIAIHKAVEDARRNVYQIFLSEEGNKPDNKIGIIQDVKLTNKQHINNNDRKITNTDKTNLEHFNIGIGLLACTRPYETTMFDALRIGFDGSEAELIADVLAEWVKADKAGNLDLTYKGKPMSPNLIAAKIIECQAPPEKPHDSRDFEPAADLYQPVPVFGHPAEETPPETKNDGDSRLRLLTSHHQFGGLFVGARIVGDLVRLSERGQSQYQVKRGRWMVSPDKWLAEMGLKIQP